MLYMAIGLPSTGKSTYISKRAPKSLKVISVEQVRKDYFQGNQDPFLEEMVRRQMLQEIEEALKAKQSECIDDQHITRGARMPIIQLAKKYDTAVVAYWFDVPFETIISWNIKREKPVPEILLYRSRDFFQEPHLDEGFEEIKKINFA